MQWQLQWRNHYAESLSTVHEANTQLGAARNELDYFAHNRSRLKVSTILIPEVDITRILLDTCFYNMAKTLTAQVLLLLCITWEAFRRRGARLMRLSSGTIRALKWWGEYMAKAQTTVILLFLCMNSEEFPRKEGCWQGGEVVQAEFGSEEENIWPRLRPLKYCRYFASHRISFWGKRDVVWGGKVVQAESWNDEENTSPSFDHPILLLLYMNLEGFLSKEGC